MNIGDQVSHYILEEKIGDGGFGDVYRARDMNSGLNVALKISRPDAGESKLKDREQRFLREVSCISKLRHPNIVQLFDYGSLPDGTLFLVMEYVCGLNLEVLIKRDAPFSFVYASEIILQVLDALDEAHRQGIVHRDLKPANIMLVRQGLRSDVVKLLDFGIAKAFDGTEPDLTRQNFQNGAGFGTPQYMPPEQFYGKKIGPHTDLYAVGLVFYELLTGKQAFTGKSLSELIQQQIHKFPEIPAPFNEGPLDTIFRRALAKQISMRYSSAQEMYQDIDAITRFCSPYLQKYSYVAGTDRASFESHSSPSLKKPPKYEEGDLDLENDESTQDTMLFADQDEDVDISDYNTLVFDGKPGTASDKYRPQINNQGGQQTVTFGDDSYIGADDDDDIEFLGPTDDMSRVDPAVAMQSAYHASSQFQQNYSSPYLNRPLPPTANSIPALSATGFPRPSQALPPTSNNVALGMADDSSMNPTVESRQPSFPMQPPIPPRRSTPYAPPSNFDPDDQPTHMMPEMPSDEMGILTGNLPARPEFAQAMHQPVVPIATARSNSTLTPLAKTADFGSSVSSALNPRTEDLPPVFHKQRTNFLHDRAPSKQRKTVLNNTFLGFWDTFFYKVRLFPPIAAFLNSGFYRSCRHAHHRVALFIDELYAEHFVGLVCGVCMIIIMLTLIIALLVM